MMQTNKNISIQPIEGITPDFIRGVDISSILALEKSGVSFKNWKGETTDIFKIMKEASVNYIRVRIWNDPFDAAGHGFGGGNNDVAAAIEIGKRATANGMKVLLNFHYSDFWADPKKYFSPRAWEKMTLLEKEHALYEFTTETLKAMHQAGVDVGMVQVGNENNNGLAGVSGFENTLPLIKAGVQAVRDVNKDILVMLHFANPEIEGSYEWIAKQINDYGIHYDIFGSSYYPFWHGTLENLTGLLSHISTTYDVDVLVAETSYAYTLEDGDGSSNVVPGEDQTTDYEISVQGQADVIRAVAQAVIDVGPRGIGIFYWEPAWLPTGTPKEMQANQALWEKHGSGWASSYSRVYDPEDAGKLYGGSSWDNQALFDFKGYPLASLNIFKYIEKGSD